MHARLFELMLELNTIKAPENSSVSTGVDQGQIETDEGMLLTMTSPPMMKTLTFRMRISLPFGTPMGLYRSLSSVTYTRYSGPVGFPE